MRNVESGRLNVGQSWQFNVSEGGGSQPVSEAQGSTRESSHDASNEATELFPQNMNQLVAQVLWLEKRVADLEQRLASQSGNTSGPSRVEFKIQKLYVRELTGTLNIGVTTIGHEPSALSASMMDITNEDEDDWRRLEEEGDQDWLTDNQ